MMRLELPKSKVDPELTKDLCKCRPICKSRYRKWNGVIQKPSAELALERRPKPECVKQWPMKVYPNSPCPLFAKKKRLVIQEKVERLGFYPNPSVVRICAAPIDNKYPSKYLALAKLAERNGAMDMVEACCPFCVCCSGKCCPCGSRRYTMRDPERKTYRREDMQEFDRRVKHTYHETRSCYHDRPMILLEN